MPDQSRAPDPRATVTPSAPVSATSGKISVLLPAYNEAENLGPVIDEIAEVITGLGRTFEIIVVDDGSTDATPSVVAALSARHPSLVGLRMRRNVGKSAALAAGFTEVTGRIVVLMDADGQDDPHELGRLLDAIDGGLDLVTGQRSIRQDRFVKRHTSRLFNTTTSWVSGVDGRDFNCGFKVMRREVADSLHLYGELHRYIPVLAHWDGFRVGEVRRSSTAPACTVSRSSARRASGAAVWTCSRCGSSRATRTGRCTCSAASASGSRSSARSCSPGSSSSSSCSTAASGSARC